ncbi:MAG: sensor histidine kinase [Lewinella sp.]|jgi:two-component system phosphate regulon sensor histidine kinase PhoR|uniref:sensor histidine kinase n=1 Tax=Lewinella sp. TaxID=2004506 RepID=UPI003D6BD282
MNKQIIWLIIGVMSLAVIGVVALQTDLTLTSIRANEDAFDKNVQNALSVVATRIEAASRTDDLLVIANGYSAEYLNVEGVVGAGENGGMSIPVGSTKVSASDAYSEKLLAQLLTNTGTGLCDECRRRHKLGVGFEEGEVQNITYDYQSVHNPIEERIDAQRLGQILEQELENNAIKTPYEFGVFSVERGTFVIRNGQYLSGDLLVSTNVNTSFPSLAESSYSVTLFENEEGDAAGNLKIYFPEKSSVLWSTLLPSFIGTFLFAALILACFGYTVWVIFHQKRLSEMKTDFINNMTHEFKTPIATISLAADSISNPKISGEISKVLRFANIIKQENKRMNSQVEKVLQMAQIDRGESQLRLTNVNLHDVISRAVENIGLQVEPRQGTAMAVLNAENPIVDGDLTHISNVINNLLDNANKYSPDAPDIVITTTDRQDGVEIGVLDHGMGMSKEARKHIFDKFYRVHTGDLHDVKGFGLGLSYVKAIMDAHKGSVEVKSDLGKGSEFILFFPRRQGVEQTMLS